MAPTAPPTADEGGGAYRKDANEVLMRDGAGVLVGAIHAAEPYPIRGLFR